MFDPMGSADIIPLVDPLTGRHARSTGSVARERQWVILDVMTAATRIERSGPAIRAALAEVSPDECAQFEAELASALEQASAELDLAPADEVLDRWWGIAAIRTNPLSEAEREQVARARAGDFTGLWEHDGAGNWVQL